MRVPFSHDTVYWPEKRWITDVPQYFHLFAVSVKKIKKKWSAGHMRHIGQAVF